MSIIQRTILREQVRELVLQRIASGEYAPKHRLVESAIAEELQISTVPVREAIRELVAIGVLEFKAHKGAWVREFRISETIDALRVKQALEPLAARLGGARLKEQCRALRRTCEAIVASARRRDFAGFQDHNQDFHRIIVQASGNAALIRTWSSLAFEVRTRFIMDFLANGDAVGIALEHEPIVEAFEEGEVERAAELLASHSKHLEAYLEQQRCREEQGEMRVDQTRLEEVR